MTFKEIEILYQNGPVEMSLAQLFMLEESLNQLAEEFPETLGMLNDIEAELDRRDFK